MKRTIKEEVWKKHYDSCYAEIRYSDLPIDIKPNDIIDIRRDEGHWSENESWNRYTELVILREREETDEEYETRLKQKTKLDEELKKRRYENYLKLKMEFEKEDN